MNRDEILDLAAVYALGALEGEDRDRFEALLRAGDREAVSALREWEETLVMLATDLRAPSVPARVKAELMARAAASVGARSPLEVVASERLRERPRRSWWPAVLTGALAAGLAALVTGLALSGVYQQRFKILLEEGQTLRAELQRQQVELQRQQAELQRQEQTLALLRDPATQVVSLSGLESSPDAKGRMVWKAGTGGLLVAEGLPPVPSGKTYQLWAIAGNNPPVSAGVFQVEPGGTGTLQVPALPGVSRVDVFAVTLEPEGGLPAPSGAMYLAGKATG
jgi:anti-sigma-K factor RskA